MSGSRNYTPSILESVRRLFVTVLLAFVPFNAYGAPEPFEFTCTNIRDYPGCLGCDLCWQPNYEWFCGLEGTAATCKQIAAALSACCATAPSSPKPPPRDWDGICPQGTTLCEPSKVSPPSTQPVPNDGLPRTCCPSTQHCYEYKASVYCAPNDQSGCGPGETFCGPSPIPTGYTGDSACCPSPLICSSFSLPLCDTIYYCSHPANGCASDPTLFPCGDNRCCKVGKEGCYLIGGGKGMCGARCHPPGKEKSENPIDPEECTPKCEPGETVCEGHPNGSKVFICCPKGSCSSSSEGAPLCIPLSTPTPTPTPIPTIVVGPQKEPLEIDNSPFDELDQKR